MAQRCVTYDSANEQSRGFIWKLIPPSAAFIHPLSEDDVDVQPTQSRPSTTSRYLSMPIHTKYSSPLPPDARLRKSPWQSICDLPSSSTETPLPGHSPPLAHGAVRSPMKTRGMVSMYVLMMTALVDASAIAFMPSLNPRAVAAATQFASLTSFAARGRSAMNTANSGSADGLAATSLEKNTRQKR